jgi:LCP family protein required for cell wall assembly
VWSIRCMVEIQSTWRRKPVPRFWAAQRVKRGSGPRMDRFVTSTRRNRDSKQSDEIPMPAAAREDGRQTVGRRLREAREARGLSLGEIEREIKVHAHHIEALESGDYEALPDPLWGRGFLITYANYLRLDGEHLAHELFPLGLAARPRLYLGRHWRALIATLGAVFVAAALIIATFVAAYDPLTGTFTGRVGTILERVAPGVFLGDEPQRVVISVLAQGGTTDQDNVLIARVGRRNVALRSVPHDTRTRIPGHGQGVVGDAAAIGGPDLTRRSIARHMGDRVPYYCSVSKEGIREIVGSMGGVQVDVPQAMSGRLAPGGAEVTLPQGRHTLDGDQALVYLQGGDLTDDEQRAKRQVNFLYAMFRQALDPSNSLANPATVKVVVENTDTNLSSVQTVQLMGHVTTLKESGASISVGSRENN